MIRVLFAAAALMTATPVLAREDAAPSVRVSLADLDVRADAEADEAYARLQRAARRVCDRGGTTLAVRAAERACRDEALARAVRDSGRAELAARHERPQAMTVAAR